jgi:hypothetical protein
MMESVCDRATEAWYPGTVMETALGMQFNCTIILKVNGFRPIIRQELIKKGDLFVNICNEPVATGDVKQLTYNRIDIFSI